jgi:thioredoxin reductase (NADPH)
MFTTRGDVYHTALAEGLGAEEDEEGQLIVDGDMRTSVPGLYAAGCVTPANCQMIIAAGQGATAAQAIDHDLFNECWRSRALPRIGRTGPEIQGAVH